MTEYRAREKMSDEQDSEWDGKSSSIPLQAVQEKDLEMVEICVECIRFELPVGRQKPFQEESGYTQLERQITEINI